LQYYLYCLFLKNDVSTIFMKIGILKKLCGLIATVAFLAQIFLPFFAYYGDMSAPNIQAKADRTPAVFGDKILICGADGFRWVSAKDLLDGGDEDAEPHERYACPMCYITAAGLQNFAPCAAGYADADDLCVKNINHTSAFTAPLSPSLWTGMRSRAPPFFSVA